MGFSGSLALLRTELPLAQFDDLVHAMWRPLFSPESWCCADGWLLAFASYGPDLAPESGVLKDLVVRTGAPALLAKVFDSDVMQLAGYDGREYWEVWLDIEAGLEPWLITRLRRAARAAGDRSRRFDFGWSEPYPEDWAQQLERGDEQRRRDRPGQARAAARWARSAGYDVPAAPIEELFGRERDPCVEDMFTDLVGLLGIDGAVSVSERHLREHPSGA